MRVKIFLFILISLLLVGISEAKEPIPFKEFITITEQALDALDEIEVAFDSSDTTKKEANASLKKLSAILKKYDRYVPGKWPDSKQGEIVMYISMANFTYKIVILAGDVDSTSFDEEKKKAEEAALNARKLFMKYKRRSP